MGTSLWREHLTPAFRMSTMRRNKTFLCVFYGKHLPKEADSEGENLATATWLADPGFGFVFAGYGPGQ
jgi:hypothetical protein